MSDSRVLVVGAGPNGLAAAITLARAGVDVRVLEAADTPGGGARTEELTLPGFHHDVCSAVHPMAVGSPFLADLPLARHGLEWIHPPAPLAHPREGGRALILERSPDSTLPGDDGWRRLVGPFVGRWWDLAPDALAPLGIPSHPLLMLRLGVRAVRSAAGLADSFLETNDGRALFAGLAAHSFLPLERPVSGGIGLLLALAGHSVGWPIPAGGAGAITRALSAHLEELGGAVETGRPVTSMDRLPPHRAVVLDLTPRQVLEVAGSRLPSGYRRKLARYRYGPGVFKVDWALDGAVPWNAPECARAATIHLGGSWPEIARSERAVQEDGGVSERPFVILAQPSLFDPARAPTGRHTAWAYCHVPHGWTGDATRAVEDQVERFAPGFRDRILSRSAMGPRQLEARNPNLVGGDIGGGAQDLGQLFFRPVSALDPYRLPADGLYLCSSSTPPGGGVHGMCGHHAAEAVLEDLGHQPPGRTT